MIADVRPSEVYTPFAGDAHSDHKVVFAAVAAATKIFRHSYIKRVLAYETLSETDFSLDGVASSFIPNIFVNIEGYLEKKLDVLSLYKSEIDDFPFPRSFKALKALASLRGAQAGCQDAEAFVLLKAVE